MMTETKVETLGDTMQYRVTIRDMETGKEAIVFPRAKKTTLFPSLKSAQSALERVSKRIGNGFVGRIYEADNGERKLLMNIAI